MDNNYFYLIIEREFIKTGESIYKIGRTAQDPPMNRFSGYPKDSHIFLVIEANDGTERAIKKQLKLTPGIIQRRDIGVEYFEGDIKLIKQICLSIINQENCYQQMIINVDQDDNVYQQIITSHEITNRFPERRSNHQCPLCKETFTRKDNLKRHSKRHCNGKPRSKITMNETTTTTTTTNRKWTITSTNLKKINNLHENCPQIFMQDKKQQEVSSQETQASIEVKDDSENQSQKDMILIGILEKLNQMSKKIEKIDQIEKKIEILENIHKN